MQSTGSPRAATTPPSRNKLLRRAIVLLLIAAGLGAFGWGYFAVNDRVIVENIDLKYGPLNGWSNSRKEAYFNSQFPTPEQISSYLSDATILHSDPPASNDVVYFAPDHSLILWHDWGYKDWRGHSTAIGTWWLKPYLQIMTYGNSRRFAVVYAMCIEFPEQVVKEQYLSCNLIKNLDQALAYDRREYRKGNIFNLTASADPPFRLSNSENVSINSLLAAMQKQPVN